MEERILIKLRELDNYLDELEQIIPTTEEEYLQDMKTRRACEKTIEIAIEAVIDLISLIVSKNKLGIPKSEDDLITLLKNKGILSVDLCQRIKEMKGFRNILVHKYGEVDDHKSYAYLTGDLGDFLSFEKEIKAYLKKRRENS